MQLRFASLTVVSLREDLHLQDRAHAGRTTVQIVAAHDLSLVVRRELRRVHLSKAAQGWEGHLPACLRDETRLPRE